MLDVVRLFHESGTVDELGIGPIRDALAEAFFPGITTIQTRARYFLIVPWQFTWREGVDQRASKGTVGAERRYRNDELDLIGRMLAGCEAIGASPNGVIGRDARRELKRLPSEVYWGGLGRWGIRRIALSRSEYLRQLDGYQARRNRADAATEDELADEFGLVSFDPHCPRAPAGFPSVDLDMNLTREEAAYLQERILVSEPSSLLAHLVGSARPVEGAVPWLWEHPERAGFPDHCGVQLEQAKLFAEVMHGAALLYNLMLAEQLKNDDVTARFREFLASYEADLEALGGELQRWTLATFWHTVAAVNPRISLRTRAFVEAWVELARFPRSTTIVESASARALVTHREFEIKRGRARLNNPARLLQWGGASGFEVLDYRWTVARGIVNDILYALGREPIVASAT